MHPDDERYSKLIGKFVQLPLTERTIPIIADNTVDPTFGTGCVKIPLHMISMITRWAYVHQLPIINIFTPDAHINENAPAAYQA